MNNIKVKTKREKLASLRYCGSQSQESDDQSNEQGIQLSQQIYELGIELLPLYYGYTQTLSKLLAEHPANQIQLNLFQQRLKLQERRQRFYRFCELKEKLQPKRDSAANLRVLVKKTKLSKKIPDHSLVEKILLTLSQQKQLKPFQLTNTTFLHSSPLSTERKPNHLNMYCQNCNGKKTQRNNQQVEASERRDYNCEKKSLKKNHNLSEHQLNVSPSFMEPDQSNEKGRRFLIPKQITNDSLIEIKDNEGSQGQVKMTERSQSSQNSRHEIFYSTKVHSIKGKGKKSHHRKSSVSSTNAYNYYHTLKKLISNQIEVTSQRQDPFNQNQLKNSKQNTYKSFSSQMKRSNKQKPATKKRLLSQSYLSRQQLKLEAQKHKYESLHTEVSETLKTDLPFAQSNPLNSDIRQPEISPEQQNAVENRMVVNLRSLFIELLESIKLVQIYKYALQNKQFDILSAIAQQHTPTMTSIRIQDIEKGIDSFFNHKNNYLVIQKIFSDKIVIDFAQFSTAFKSNLTELEFKLLKPKTLNQSRFHRLHTLILTLFQGWIEVDYFQKHIKAFFQKHATIYYNFIHQIRPEFGSEAILDKLLDFIYGESDNENQMRANRKNVEIFLKHYLKINTFEQFCCWAYEPHYLVFRKQQ